MLPAGKGIISYWGLFYSLDNKLSVLIQLLR